MRRQSRLFAIAEHLRSRRTGITAEELAARFGVTVRTIYRDLDALREAELPLQADRGRGGGYALDRAYSLPPVNFTAREAALIITLGRWAREMRLLPFAVTLERGLEKIRGALSASAQRELIALMDGLKFVGVPALPVKPALRETIEHAWFEKTPLAIAYQKADHTVSKRTARITSVVMERSLTLLNCEDVATGEARQLRLDRVLSARAI